MKASVGLMRAAVKLTVRPLLRPGVPIALQRAGMRLLAASNPAARGVRVSEETLGGVRALRLEAAPAERHVLYFHGGGYCLGAPETHRGLLTHLARAAQAAVHAPRYRRAPEHPHPAALEDAIAAWDGLVASGLRASDVALAGDSAGAGLALALAQALRDRGQVPAALALISPWVDLTLSGDSHRERAAVDPMLSTRWLADCARHYAGADLERPACSPLKGDLSGLPPMLIQVGSDEILRSDAEDLAGLAAEAGVEVHLREFEGLWHDFQLHAGVLGEADEALAEIAAFLRSPGPQE